ncbi:MULTISPECIES: heavy metal-binding domain-containing protein [Hymenobacter]|uniref:Heavy metal binding domain-containing protein n=1 Tax=Hymenobacter metallilatus TaxID=2493666 RepID=A0A428IZD5_9BACT|nr:heavy metal-binding domain-containing protein [Hymenobacter metallilatus]RSK24493.1 hypothetical protein EI290_19270 [Hymenobacter metallilatus]
MKSILSFAAVLASVSILASGCSDNANKGGTTDATTTTTAPAANSDTTAASAAGSATEAKVGQYTCPMHPEVVSDQPGKCPKCGMTLVKKS